MLTFKKTTMKKILYYILAGALVTTGSCKKGFLDRYPQTTISPELFFKSEQDLSLYVNGLPNLPGTGSYLNDQSSDNLATTASLEIKNIMTGSPSSKTLTDGWDWARLRNINYFLGNYGRAVVQQEVKDHYAGLARYYRAQFYMGMVKRYNNVPWYSGTINPDDSTLLYMAPTPRAQVVDSVMADLAFAAGHVRSSVPAGTPGVWAVKTFYARTALYEGTYRKYHPELNLVSSATAFLEKARDMSKEIMGSGNFQLYNTGNPAKDYGALFATQDLSASKEVILNTPYDASKAGASNSNNNSTVFGDYEQSPSRSLVQTYLMKDGTPLTAIPGYDKFGFVKEFENRDPRMKQTLAYPGFMRITDSKPYIQRLNKNFTGYHQLKGYFSSTTDNVVLGSFDFPVYRYAEVLLINAEALAELGTITQTDLDKTVNLIRSRAGVAALNLVTANGNPDPAQWAQYPDVSGAQAGVLLEIRRERRVEFALEGYRYDDLMRWHAGKLLEKIPEGMYFPGLGKYDMTGDGNEDIILIDKSSTIPAEALKEKNALGDVLVYYKAGSFGESVTVYLRNGNSGGTLVTETTARQFIDPKYYYRPIPYTQVVLNPKLTQVFGWQ
jgi:hypothetical protein